MADVLAYAETRDGALRPVAGEVVATARKLADQLNGQVVAVVVGLLTESERRLRERQGFA